MALLFSTLAPKVFSQEFNFNRAYQDYLYSFNQYQFSHQEYLAAKSAYFTYQTLTAETEAITKTAKMLQLRDEVIRTYLTAIRLRLAEATGISNYELNILYLKLDNDVAWYQDHQKSFSSAGNLDDLTAISAETEKHYGLSEALAYQTLGSILVGKQDVLRNQFDEEIQLLKDKVGEIRQRGDKNTDILSRWLLEAENKNTQSQGKQFESQNILANLSFSSQDSPGAYNQARFLLRESNLYLQEANSYLKEIVREIKNAD